MFCNKCGAMADDGAVFCRKCGNRLPVINQEPAEPVEDIAVDAVEATEEVVSDTAEQDVAPVDEFTGVMEELVSETVAEAATDEPAVDEVAGEVTKSLSEDVTGMMSEEAVDTTAANDADIQPEIAPVNTYSYEIPDVNTDITDNKSGVNKKTLIGVIAAAVAALVVLVLIASGTNAFKRTFLSPEKYYSYVEKRNISKGVETFAKGYTDVIIDRLAAKKSGSESSLNVKLSDDIIDEIENIADAHDLDFLSDISIKVSEATADNLAGSRAAIVLNGTQLLEFEAIMDAEDEVAYFRIPEINEEYIESELNDDSEAKDVAKTSTDIKKMADALPRAAKLTKLVDKYSDIALSSINDVSKEKKTMEIADVREKVYVLKVKLDDDQLKKAVKAMRKEADKDKDLQGIIIDCAEAAGEDGDKAWDAFYDALYDLEDAVKKSDMTMKVYVNSKGDIIGRELYDDTGSFEYLTVTDGRAFATEASVEDNNRELFWIEGSGKKSGDEYSGDFTVSVEGNEFDFTVDRFNVKSMFSFAPDFRVSVKIGDLLDAGNIKSRELDYIEDYSLVMDVKMKSVANGSASIMLLDGEEEAVSMSASVAETSGYKLQIPEDTFEVEDTSDFKHYLKDCDFDEFYDKLRDAGVSKEYVDGIKELENYIDYMDLLY